MRPLLWILGAICGVAWWAVSLLLGAKAYGVLGAYAATGAVAGACTGVASAALAWPVYRLRSPRALLWYSPLSVYVAIALYGVVVFVIRSFLNDFHPGQVGWAVGVEAVLGMWWGVTMLLPIGVPVQLLAYANHSLLRTLAARGPMMGSR